MQISRSTMQTIAPGLVASVAVSASQGGVGRAQGLRAAEMRSKGGIARAGAVDRISSALPQGPHITETVATVEDAPGAAYRRFENKAV